MRVIGKILAAIVLLAVAWFAFVWIWGVPRVDDHPTLTDSDAIARGRYLAIAGDCVSCHTAEGGAALAGGAQLMSPFGAIVTTNITPAASGIGGMSSAAFYRIMAYGADSIWHPLYPAMPYTSYHLVTRDDSDALHAYLMSLPPVENALTPTRLRFPFNVRPGIFAWNLLFAERKPFAPDPARSEGWNRGAYLIGGLGHCGACHTPRNLFFAEKTDLALKGARLGTMIAPDITAAGLAARGWSFDDMVGYLATGDGPRGSSFGEMKAVIRNSTALMTPEDRVAMATFLFDDKVPEAAATAAVAAAAGNGETLGQAVAAGGDGKALYLGNCALCHKATGAGIPNTTPTLAGNSTVMQADGRNLVIVTADGLHAAQIVPGTGVAALGPMPAFRDRLGPAEMTALVNYVRTAFGDGTLAALTEDQVKAILGGK